MDAQSLAILSLSIPFIIGVLSYLLAQSSRYKNFTGGLCTIAALASFTFCLALVPTVMIEPIQIELSTLPLLSTTLEIGLYLDSLSLSFAILITLFGVLVSLYGASYFSTTQDSIEKSIADRSMSFYLILIGGLLGILFSRDLLMLLIFWEITSLSLYVLILHEKSSEQSFKAFLMTHAGGLGLFGVTILIHTTIGTLEIHEIGLSPIILGSILPILIPLTLLAVFPKGIQFPFHTWLTDGAIAPSSTMVLFIAGDLAGIYLLLRLIFQAFEPAFSMISLIPLVQLFGDVSAAGLFISIIGSITLVIGAINALTENDLLRIIAFSAASELGFVFILLGLGFPLGITASMFYAISHTLVVGLLFLCAGAVIVRTGKREIGDLGGLYHSMPITASCAAVSVLAIGGLPLLSEFIAKYLVVISTIAIGSPFFLFIAILGELLHIVIATRFLYSVFLARGQVVRDPNVADPPRLMLVPMLLMTALIFIIGINPTFIIEQLIFPSVTQMGYSINEVIPFLILPIYGGVWSPIIITVSTLFLLSLTIFAVNYSVNKGKFKHESYEEAFKPFVCGEDSSEYTPAYSDLFYTIRYDFFKLDELVHKTNIDRFYHVVSSRIYGACSKLLRFDVTYQFARGFLWFISGILVTLVIAFLLV